MNDKSTTNLLGPHRGVLEGSISPGSFWYPDYVCGSGWLDHAPFAYWIIGVLKPRRLVELGVHGGYSYFCFCQAVRSLGLDTRCFGIDTWRGDEHAGFYGESVFQNVKDRNNRYYAAFSELVRSSFDEALPHFEDASVDLLHIDGRHFFEDVKHDFESWKCKLSSGAVVLFHDTNARERAFGAFQLWAELKDSYPSFEFLHGYGLGVLGYGSQLCKEMTTFFKATTDPAVAAEVRRAYGRLGGAIKSDFVGQERLQQAQSKSTQLATELDVERTQSGQMAERLQQLTDRLDEVAGLLQQRDAEFGELQAKRNEEFARHNLVVARLKEREAEFDELQARRLDRREADYRALVNSTSWRMTAPLRKFGARIPWLARNGRRLLKLVNLSQAARTLRNSGGFDRDWYFAQNPDVAKAGANPLVHYLRFGAREGRDPNPLFDTDWYLAQNPDVAKAGANPLVHYLRFGAKEGRDPNPLFDTDWYLAQNPDVAEAGANPLIHYLRFGAKEGRDPNPQFDTGWYLARNPDVAKAGTNPLVHFVRHGRFKGRPEAPVYDPLVFAAYEAEAVKDCPGRYHPLLERLQALAATSKICATREAHPVVSVIIPVYNGLHFTLACLTSISRASPKVPFEVIVIDNQSTDKTEETLRHRTDIMYLRNSENIGFLRSCNRAATFARGEFIFLLNNDTVVREGWLDELVNTFTLFGKVGLTGSKLIFPDGTLQEAGGIVWSDGSSWNFGRSQDALHPTYNYAREVDYISGCAIMVPTTLWRELGGFDELFVPSYCEDVDLALRIRKRGYSVMYQPLSTVVHFEGMTQGRDITSGTKAYQAINTKKLRERWKDYLATLQEPGSDVDRAKDRGVQRRVLFLDNVMLTPDQDAGSLASMNLILLFQAAGFTVTFVPQDNLESIPRYTRELQRRGIEVLYRPIFKSVRQHLEEHGKRYDVVLIARPQSYQRHFDTIRSNAPQAKTIYYSCDLHFLRMEREISIDNSALAPEGIEQMREVELAAVKNCDATFVHSSAEQELLTALGSDTRVHLFPWAIPINGTKKDFRHRKDILFLGGYQHPPNVDAVVFFAKEVMPIITASDPTIVFKVVGSKAPSAVQSLAGPNIEVLGFVKDLSGVLDEARVSVAPLRFGAGLKGKVVTAMSVGLPSVLTSVAAEGFEVQDGVHALIADQPAAIARAVLRLYQDEALWTKISEEGFRLAEESFGPLTAWRRFMDVLNVLGLGQPGPFRPPRLMRATNMSVEVSEPPMDLSAVALLTSKKEYEGFLASAEGEKVRRQDAEILDQHAQEERWSFPGYSEPARAYVNFEVDMLFGGARKNGRWVPNIRERLSCPLTNLNNRQRLVATVLRQTVEASPEQHSRIYMMEQITPIFTWGQRHLPSVIGSEYLGDQYKSGDIVNGVRHEDVHALSFEDESFDVIVSNEVMEHIPVPNKGFRECVRILRPGGTLLMTIPLIEGQESSVTRAVVRDGALEYILPPIYHGNPVSEKGSLVFTDYGWDVIDILRGVGFSNVTVEMYHSLAYAQIGGGLFVIRAVK
jgi:GT2 family glycosyltransferase/glycosyltransferase involved in cell wall biosynthesis